MRLLPYPNLYLNRDTFQDAIKASGYDRIKLIFDPEYYKVFQNKLIESPLALGQTFIEEVNLNLMAVDPNGDFRYKFQRNVT